MGKHHIPVRIEDRQKSAFLTQKGLFLFNVMPFALCNAPATFQRLLGCLQEAHRTRHRGVLR